MIWTLQWTADCLAADGVEVVVPAEPQLDVGGGEVGPVLLQD